MKTWWQHDYLDRQTIITVSQLGKTLFHLVYVGFSRFSSSSRQRRLKKSSTDCVEQKRLLKSSFAVKWNAVSSWTSRPLSEDTHRLTVTLHRRRRFTPLFALWLLISVVFQNDNKDLNLESRPSNKQRLISKSISYLTTGLVVRNLIINESCSSRKIDAVTL